MKCSLGISNFLEEISSLSHSVVFLYFFALIAEEGFLVSTCYSLELCIQMLSFSPLRFASLLFTAICKASSDSHFAFLHLFSTGMVLSDKCYYFHPVCGLCFYFLSLVAQKSFILIQSHLFLPFSLVLLVSYLRHSRLTQGHEVTSLFLSKSSKVLALPFRSIYGCLMAAAN